MINLPFWMTFALVTASMLIAGRNVGVIARFWAVIFGGAFIVLLVDHFSPGFAAFMACIGTMNPSVPITACQW